MDDWRSDNRRQGRRRGGSKDFGGDGDDFDHGKRNKPERGGRRDSFGEPAWGVPGGEPGFVPDDQFGGGGRFGGGDDRFGGDRDRGPSRSYGERGSDNRREGGGPRGGGYGGPREGGGGYGGPREGGGGYGGPREGGGGYGGPREGGGGYGGPRGGGGFGGPRGGGGGERGPRRSGPPVERGPRQLGTVKFFKSDKGFGFIMPDNGDADVFVHISAVERSGLTSLDSGQRVSFETEPDRHGKGPKAVELKIEEGGEQPE
jgi:CspA family cold shock protein